MRLLKLEGNSELSLTADIINPTTPYAILSHTWGDDGEEVSFKDLKNSSGKTKDGYKKLRFCGEQAARDGLQYFWVDTCCIDKSSSAELQEAINSMFRWYHNAAKCYVYLSDVSTKKRKASDQLSVHAWESAFRSSRWFTRGWTLQELLAPCPDSVEFFSREGDRLGDKRTLEGQIHEITGIPISALQGKPLSHFNTNDRLLWAEKRQTTREEDKAYSLLGIFDVQIPLLYGEGREKAFKRLREEIDKPPNGAAQNFGLDRLNYLPSAVDAPFNSLNRQHDPICLPKTRVDLLQKIYDWVDGRDERCIFWLNGLAGTGKSTIARTVAHEYFKQKRLAASFFFSKGGGDVGHAGRFFTSLAIQLARNVPQTRQYIADALLEQDNIADQSLRDQWRQLILRPLSRLDSRSSYVLIVDALDECDNENDIRIILQLLSEARTLKTVRLQIFLTSRPEIPIRHGFYQIPDNEHQNFVLHNISPSIVNRDIGIFIQYSLKLIAAERSLGTVWPGEQIIERLVYSASGLFIWAATACRFIREGKRFATKRLDMILEKNSTTMNSPEKHLDEIYLTVLRQSISTGYSVEEAEELCCTIKSLLGSIVTLFSPLPTQSLSNLINISKEELNQTLDDLHAILDVPLDQTSPIRLHHPSFRDFLYNEERCSDSNFRVDEKQAHQILADYCIQLMSKSLKKDICKQYAPGTLVTNVARSRIEQCIPPSVQYACLYWIQHLQRSGPQLCDNDQVHQFLQEHLLHWLEALGWMRKSSEGILVITSLESIALTSDCPRLYALVHDLKRFALYNRIAIERSPLQVYCSALVFAPANSIVRQHFVEQIPRWIQRLPNVQADWNAALQTLEGHLGRVSSVAFSPDGKLVVSGSGDETVRLWDVVTGAALQTLEGHSSLVNSVAFSPDGKKVVSSSNDMTVRLWDARTGAALQTLRGHSGSVQSVAFSPDSKLVVSGSDDGTVRLWDVVTSAVPQIFECHSSKVFSVAFSPDSKLVVSGSSDKTVRLWDAVTGAVLQTFMGHLIWIISVAFSPDSKQIVSSSTDKTVRLWDAVTGAALQTLEGHSDWVNSVAFSPDGKKVVSSSDDMTVRLWDARTGAALQTLRGHLDRVQSVAFSPDSRLVVSGSFDRMVCLWDAVTGATLQTLENNSNKVWSIAFSSDGKQVVSGSLDGTARLWDVITGTALQTLEGHSNLVIQVAFSPDSRQVVSGSGDRTVRLWDTMTGAALQTLKGHSDLVYSVAVSPDSTQVLSGSGDKTVRLWDAITGATLQVLKGHSSTVRAVAFSPNGKQVVSGSEDRTVRLWDAVTGAPLQTLEGHSKGIFLVAFSPDGKQVVSSSTDKTVRFWDAITGAVLQIVKGSSNIFNGVAFSSDSKVVYVPVVSDNWVVEEDIDILWLPLEYRPTCLAVWNRTIVLGHSSGRISILEFKEGLKLI